MRNIVIIGGGAAGLMAAASCEGENKITVIEKNTRPARKVMITGKGRCNVTNNSNVNTLINNTAKNGKFLYSAFSAFNSEDTIKFFQSRGVPLKTERGNRVFPVSDKAVSIVDALISAACEKADIKVGTAQAIICKDGAVCGVKLSSEETLPADAVILATGGKSYPLTGSTGDGYTLARALGHTVTKLSPSLIRLDIREGFCTHLAGLTLKNVTLSLFKNGAKKPVYSELGELLFTHTGISGPLTLSASAHIDGAPEDYFAEIDLKPALDNVALDKRILRDFEEEKNRDLSNALYKLLPKSLIPVIIGIAGIDPRVKINQLSRENRESLINAIKHLKVTVKDFGDFDEAVVTRGGVSVKEINPGDMSSKLIKNLYFAGEIIDVDAFTGGFNLQIAFSTGYLAGKSASKNKESGN
ncbi:MAG: NAD(P)/FAD-dependent oxidoreductase [Clostridia bacterium]|nr:NAD(P)/FAD-dependent oxidoreductase [Clostridia bacterium]